MCSVKRIGLMSLIVTTGLFFCGCDYYKVTDPGTGNVYFTTSVGQDWGAAKFKDDRTQGDIRLQNYDVRKITKQEYDKDVAGNK